MVSVVSERQRAAVVGKRDFHDAGAGPECGERLRRPQHVDQPAADDGVAAGRRGDEHAVGIGQQEAAAAQERPIRQRVGEHFLRPQHRIVRLGERPVEALGGQIADGRQRQLHLCQRLAAMIQHLHGGADADGQQEGDDEDGNGAAKQGFRRQKAAIGRLGNGLRKAFDRIAMCRRTRQVGARHRPPPCGISPDTHESEGCAASLSESVSIGIDGR